MSDQDPILTTMREIDQEQEGIIVPAAAPTNTAAIGVTGSQQDGVAVGAQISKGLGKGRSVDAQGGWSQKRGWGFAAFFRKFWLVPLLVAAAPLAAQDPRPVTAIAEDLERLATEVRALAGPPVVHVPAGGNLQAAIAGAAPGTHVTLEPGVRYVGAFTVRSDITVRSAAALPNRRLTPADAHLLPVLASGSSAAALSCLGASNITIDGVAFGSSATGDGTVVALQDCDSVTLDRVLFVGGVNGQKRFVQGNGTRITLTRSHCANVWKSGQDSQCFSAWDGAGPYTITDNFLEAASENVMFGGADSKAPERVPSDILVEGNHFFKPLSWQGQAKVVKNLFELKAARRVVVRNNRFENCWRDGQTGFAIVITPRNQNGAAPWTHVADVRFEDNVVIATKGVNLSGHDDLQPSRQTSGIVVRRNLWRVTSSFLQTAHLVKDATFDHNTIVGVRYHIALLEKGWRWVDGARVASPYAVETFTWTNNLVEHGEYGFFASGVGMGAAGFGINQTTIWGLNVVAGGRDGSLTYPAFPAGTLRPTPEEFAAQFDADYQLVASSPWRTMDQNGGALGR